MLSEVDIKTKVDISAGLEGMDNQSEGKSRRRRSRRSEMAEKLVDVERDEGDPVGITVDSALTVTKVVPSSIADGNINIGDVILTINDARVRDRDDYYHKLRFAHPRLRITFRRPGEAPAAAAPKAAPVTAAPAAAAPVAPKHTDGREPVTEDEEKFLRRRSGFDYLVQAFDWPAQQERQLGIVLANRMHKVIVGSLKSGSLGEEKLKVLDRVVSINGNPVSDKDVAKALIVGAGGKFTALVERPLSDEAKSEHQKTKAAPTTAAAAPGVQFSDVGGDSSILPIDCLLITKTIREGAPLTPAKGILRGPQLARPSSKIDIRSESKEHFIASDVDPNKRLRRVAKN